MAYWDFSGVIRIIQNGGIILETSRGYSNIEFSIKNTMETGFTVASWNSVKSVHVIQSMSKAG